MKDKLVYIVLHHEIMGSKKDNWHDEMVFYVCDSMKDAIKAIKSSKVCRWSWWEIQSQVINRIAWPEHVGYYGVRGGKLTKSPYEKCLQIFKVTKVDY